MNLFKPLLAKPSAGSSLLFGALADSGQIKQRKNGKFRMVLKGVDEIDWFTDRPNRVAGEWSPKKLLRKWDGLFGGVEPNTQATFEVGSKRKLVTFKMFKPKLRDSNQTLSFKIRGIGEKNKDLLTGLRNKQLSDTSLFIDGSAPPCLPDGEGANPSLAYQVLAPDVEGADPKWADQVFAPYVDMTRFPPPSLIGAAENANAEVSKMHFNAAFIQSTGYGKAAWGGDATLPITNTNGQAGNIKKSITDAQAAGAEVAISFGGPHGETLAVNFYQSGKTAQDLADTYSDVLTTFNVNRLDFDIEGDAASDTGSIDLRSEAIKLLQDKHQVDAWFTITVLPSGLTSEGLNIVKSAIDAEVDIGGVNIKAMNYGASFSGDMGDYANMAAESTLDQIIGLYTDAKKAKPSYANIGITPMIGVNNISQNIFTLDNAQTVEMFAEMNKVGMIGMWELGRDVPGTSGGYANTGLSDPAYSFTEAWADYGV